MTQDEKALRRKLLKLFHEFCGKSEKKAASFAWELGELRQRIVTYKR